MYKKDLALNDQQWLICQPNQTYFQHITEFDTQLDLVESP